MQERLFLNGGWRLLISLLQFLSLIHADPSGLFVALDLNDGVRDGFVAVPPAGYGDSRREPVKPSHYIVDHNCAAFSVPV